MHGTWRACNECDVTPSEHCESRLWVVVSNPDVRVFEVLSNRHLVWSRSGSFGFFATWIGEPCSVKPNREKQLAYESGVDPVGDGWVQSQIRYYVFALLFVIFDVEAVFIFPWATQLERYAGFGLVEMGIFVFVLLLGLVYAWRKGVLRWI